MWLIRECGCGLLVNGVWLIKGRVWLIRGGVLSIRGRNDLLVEGCALLGVEYVVYLGKRCGLLMEGVI